MNQSRSRQTQAAVAIFWGAIFVAVILRLYLVMLPPEIALMRWGTDDMFYYSQIAGHLAHSGFLSFDGITPASGVQPLFTLMLWPFGAWVLDDFAASVFVIFVMISMLHIATGFALRYVILSLGGAALFASFAVAIFLLHPKIISMSFQGTEASLAFLLLTSTLWAWHGVQEGRVSTLSASAVFAGLVLTRLDFALFLLGLALWSLLTRSLRMTEVLALLPLPLLALMGWCGFIWYQTGSALPDSGVAKTFLLTALFAELNIGGVMPAR